MLYFVRNIYKNDIFKILYVLLYITLLLTLYLHFVNTKSLKHFKINKVRWKINYHFKLRNSFTLSEVNLTNPTFFLILRLLGTLQQTNLLYYP